MKNFIFLIIIFINSGTPCSAEYLSDPRYPDLLSLTVNENHAYTISEYRLNCESVFSRLSGEDKKLSLEEYLEIGKKWRNNDQAYANMLKKGYSREEISKALEKPENFMRESEFKGFNIADADKDGFLNQNEYFDIAFEFFKLIDSNNDKNIDRKEIETFQKLTFAIRDKANEVASHLRRLDLDRAENATNELGSMSKELSREK